MRINFKFCPVTLWCTPHIALKQYTINHSLISTITDYENSNHSRVDIIYFRLILIIVYSYNFTRALFSCIRHRIMFLIFMSLTFMIAIYDIRKNEWSVWYYLFSFYHHRLISRPVRTGAWKLSYIVNGMVAGHGPGDTRIRSISSHNFDLHLKWPVKSAHKGQWGGALMSSLVYAWTNG